MSRVQLALNVSNIEDAVTFYSKLFGSEPAMVRPGYANFAIADPPLKLVLIESTDTTNTVNHLGVEVESSEAVVDARRRLTEQGLATANEDQVECCYARQDKVWVDGPDGEPWEIYTVLEHVEMPQGRLRAVDPAEGAGCCAPTPEAAASLGCCG
jgi:catechol 2,3-dioxygenase-like lactoylglutathione lyase family enzyme